MSTITLVPSDVRGCKAYEVSISMTDDADATLPLGSFSGKTFVGAMPVRQVNSAGRINWYTVNATGTAVVVNASFSTASAKGDVRWRVYFKE